ncbi:unnamed protein product [Schistosoma mattheei]|uniref:Uncharacterized protein n=1 Tax=Schistosoma mattheei TaxID=31246 RepID=A0A183PFX1_9TREM|nr:unnamed protein product [Schistosoma mattheei]
MHLPIIDFISTNIKQAKDVLKNFYDGGSDGIPSSFVEYGSRGFSLLPLNRFNLSMNYGAYTSVCKTSLNNFGFKTGSLSDIANYRSTNLTSVLSRTLENSSTNRYCHLYFRQARSAHINASL